MEQKQPSQYKKSFDPRSAHKQKERCSKCDSTQLEGFQCPAKRYQYKTCHKFGHFTSLCFMKNQQKQAYHKPHKPKVHQLTEGVTCLSAMFKSLIDVITFISEMQVFMYDKSNFIVNPQYIYKYIHSKHVE